jgi:hypothetical protein
MVASFHLIHPQDAIYAKIFSTCNGSIPNRQKYTSFHNVYPSKYLSQVSASDPLPNLICHRCLYEVDRFHDFKEICEKANTTLQQCFNRRDNMDLTKVKKYFVNKLTDFMCMMTNEAHTYSVINV